MERGPGRGLTPSEPAAVKFGNDLYVFVRGFGDGIFQNRRHGSTWSGWSELPGGGLTPSGPAAVKFGNDLYVFVRGTDDRIYQNKRHGSTWSGWSELPAAD